MSIIKDKFKQAIHSENYGKSKSGKILSKLLILTVIVVLIFSSLVYIVFKNSNIVPVRKGGIAMSSSEEKSSRPTTDDNVFVHVDSIESAGNDREAPLEIRSEWFTGIWLGEIKEDGETAEIKMYLQDQGDRIGGDLELLSKIGSDVGKRMYFPLLQIKQTGSLLTFFVLVDGLNIKFELKVDGSRLSGNFYSLEKKSEKKQIFFTRQRNEQLNGPLDVDWNVGILSDMLWDFQYLPQEFKKHKKELRPSDSLSHHIDMKIILSASSKTLCIPIHSSYLFRFHEIVIVSEQFMFIGTKPHVSAAPASPRPSDYNVRVETCDHVTIYHGSDSDVDRYLAAVDKWHKDIQEYYDRVFRTASEATSSLKLKAFYLFPDERNAVLIIEKLTKAFRGTPTKKRFSLLMPQGPIQWDIAEWKDEYNVCRYVDITQNGKNLTHYILIGSPSGLKTLTNLVGLSSKDPTSDDISKLMKALSEKEWQAGYGWIRQRLGSGLDLPNTILSDLGILTLSGQLIYPYSVAGDVYCLVFFFDAPETFSSVRLIPSPEGNPKRTDSGPSAIEKR